MMMQMGFKAYVDCCWFILKTTMPNLDNEDEDDVDDVDQDAGETTPLNT
jgi:hypothetical protein